MSTKSPPPNGASTLKVAALTAIVSFAIERCGDALLKEVGKEGAIGRLASAYESLLEFITSPAFTHTAVAVVAFLLGMSIQAYRSYRLTTKSSAEKASDASDGGDTEDGVATFYAKRNVQNSVHEMIARLKSLFDHRVSGTMERRLLELDPQIRAFYITMHKAGFSLPQMIRKNQYEHTALLRALQQIAPLLDAGHYEEAKTRSAEVASMFNADFVERAANA
jgi:hypothetical protein